MHDMVVSRRCLFGRKKLTAYGLKQKEEFMQENREISKFVSDVFRYDTNNMAGYQNGSGCTYNNQGQCTMHCCEKEMER